MKNSNNTIGNRNRELLAQCLDHLRRRLPNSKQYINIYLLYTFFLTLQLFLLSNDLIPKHTRTSTFVNTAISRNLDVRITCKRTGWVDTGVLT